MPEFILVAFNPTLKVLPNVYDGQVLRIPNLDDIPSGATFQPPPSASNLIARARKAIDFRIKYKLGHGGKEPDYKSPTKDGYCDCSGFICGISRKTTIPFYLNNHGGWIYTDSMVDDINRSAGIFERLNYPNPDV